MKVLVLMLSLLVVGCSSLQPDQPGTPDAYSKIPLATEEADIVPPVVRNRVEPLPPQPFRLSRTYADAVVQAVIDERGVVKDAWYVKGDREWAKYLIAAVRKWQFEPALQQGRPVAVRFNVFASFRATKH